MKIHLFENLELNLKASITWKDSVHIGHRTNGSYYMFLYRLNDFYVEIQYNSCFDGIASIQTFSCEDELQPYLDQVDIQQLLN